MLNAAVLWNTIYIEEALNCMKGESMEVKEEDVARLSPLMHEHIIVLGHYSFTLAESIMRDEHNNCRMYALLSKEYNAIITYIIHLSMLLIKLGGRFS